MRLLLGGAALFASITALISGLIWRERVSMDYNTEGRYLDEQTGVVYGESAVLVYGWLALLSAVIAVIAWFIAKRR